MGKTTIDAKPHFGRRIVQLRLKKGMKRAELARAIDVPYRTLQEWEKKPKPPRTARDRLPRLAEVLGEAPWESDDGDQMRINEARLPFGPNQPIRYAEPLDFKKDALCAIGRGRHAVAQIRGHIRDNNLTLAELARLLSLADHEMADAQSNIMEKIEVNDRGEKL